MLCIPPESGILCVPQGRRCGTPSIIIVGVQAYKKKDSGKKLVSISTPVQGCCADMNVSRLEFDELIRIMGKIESVLIRHRSDAPLLHGQCAKENLYRPAVFVLADLIE